MDIVTHAAMGIVLAAPFVENFAAWAQSDVFSWWGVVGIQSPVTLGILIVEVRRPRYRGIFSRPRNAAGPDVEIKEEPKP